MDGEEENWRENEESLDSAVLEAVRDVDRAKEASFCMRGGCGENVNTGRSL
jgi:hypothetical protein